MPAIETQIWGIFVRSWRDGDGIGDLRGVTQSLDYHRDSLRLWLNRGLDGFRFDAVPHLVENGPKDWNDQPGSYALMAHVNALMSGYQHRHMVCEATASPTRWAAPYVCGSAFAFGMEHQFVDAARGKPEAIRAVADYFKTAPLTMATMVSNHDIFAGERLWDQVKGDVAQYRLAAASYLEDPLRVLLHMLLSRPEYQLG